MELYLIDPPPTVQMVQSAGFRSAEREETLCSVVVVHLGSITGAALTFTATTSQSNDLHWLGCGFKSHLVASL